MSFFISPNISILIFSFFVKSPSDVMLMFHNSLAITQYSHVCSSLFQNDRLIDNVNKCSVLINSSQLRSVIKMSDVENNLLVKFCCLQINCLHVSLDMIEESSYVLLQIISLQFTIAPCVPSAVPLCWKLLLHDIESR